jgi:hypothetical protein
VKLPTGIVLAAIAALLVALPGTAQTPQATPFSADMQIKYEVGEAPQQWHGKLYVSTEHMRFDMQNPPHEGPIVLTNFSTQTDDVLLPEMKAYVEHPVDDPHARGPAWAMRDLRAYDPGNPCSNQPNLSCKKIGVETVGGRSCEHWELDRNGKVVNLWIDQKLRFPLKTATEDATITLSSVKEGAPASTLFQVPANYKKVNMHPPAGGTTASQPRP